MSQAHATAVTSFDKNHVDYDASRFSFPESMIDTWLCELGLASLSAGKYRYHTDKVILEIASGTGKLTRSLIERGWGKENSRGEANLLIVEPSEGMITTLMANFPDLDRKWVMQSSSYDLKLPDRSVDSVLIAQAFHWFADTESLKEIDRVLRSEGTLGMLWNFDIPSVSQDVDPQTSIFIDAGSSYYDVIEDTKQESVLARLNDLFGKQPWSNKVTLEAYKHDGDVPQYRKGDWKRVVDENEYFQPIHKNIFAVYDKFITKEQVYKYWETRSYITSLSEKERELFKANLYAIIDNMGPEDAPGKIDGEATQYLKPVGVHATVLQKRA